MKKTISFAVVHFSVAFTVGYVMTGSVLVGGTMALIEPAINTVAFYVHERIWTKGKQAYKKKQALADVEIKQVMKPT